MKILSDRRIAIGLLCAGISAALLIGLLGHILRPNAAASWVSEDAIWTAYLAAAGQNRDGLEIVYPFDGTVFPPEIVEPTFRWRDKHPGADTWLVVIQFADEKGPLKALTHVMEWTPSPRQWQDVTARSVESPAKVTIIGVNQGTVDKVPSFGTVSISTSKDVVGAPLFFREVGLPFKLAVTDPAKFVRWRFGPISSREPPPIVLDKLPVCANCHSFPHDGATLAMALDAGNEKGGYVIAPIKEETALDLANIIDWNDYRRGDGQPTFGLLCQISPDGKHVAGTVKDRAIAVYTPDLMFSQVFFVIKGIIAIHDRETKTIRPLPGADDPEIVQTNPSWSPDGKYIVFARSRSKAYNPKSSRKYTSVFVPSREADEFLKGGTTFLYDLYRIPFNQGQGGKAEPVEGASNNGMSNYFAKYSPDGKWIVFCQAKSFMLLQPDSQLYIIPAAGGKARRLQCNTVRMNSWHSWSPNGKWLAFSSKINGPYTQLFLTHMDEEGNSTPPVVLDRLSAPEWAVNIPEFVNQPPDAIRKIHAEFMDDHSHWRAGAAFASSGDWEKAERMYRRALKLNPRSAEAHASLGLLLIRGKQLEEGMPHLDEALEIAPDSAEARVNLGALLGEAAWVLATSPDASIRNGKKAVDLAQRAVQLTGGKDPSSLDILAAACAEAGRFAEAIQTAQKALDLTNEQRNKSLGEAIQSRLKLYRAGSPFRSEIPPPAGLGHP